MERFVEAEVHVGSSSSLTSVDDIESFLERDDVDLNGMSKRIAWSLLVCTLRTCLTGTSQACDVCMKEVVDQLHATEIGVNGLPLKYGTGMLSIPIAGGGTSTYVNAWCGGNLANCNTKDGFPGPNTTSIMDWERVWRIGSETPKNEWSGNWWRGNELGFIINNPYFWSASGIDPYSITLGILPSQHAAIRPVMEKMFGAPDSAMQATIDQYIADFMTEKAQSGMNVPSDVTELVHRILNKVAFNRGVSAEYAKTFVALQGQVVALGTVSQLLPSAFYFFLKDIRTKIAEYIDEYEVLIGDLYGEELRNEDCSPSASCERQAASMAFDALYSAGGLSVPTTIATGLGLLFSKDQSSPFPQASYPAGKELEFYWENVRYFAPVVGFPHWETRPTCAGSTEAATRGLNAPEGKTKACPLGAVESSGYPKVNQYMGGTRVVPNMALAQRDLRVWGSNGNDFVIRDDYSKSVGFAEMAVDNTVAGGRMNRICPGKTLALTIGASFFKAFDKSSWEPCRIPITFGSGPTYVSGFTLSSKSMVSDCKEVCPSCGLSASCFVAKSQCEAQKASCSFCKSCKTNPPKWWHWGRKWACRRC